MPRFHCSIALFCAGVLVAQESAPTVSRVPTVQREGHHLPKMLGNYDTFNVSPVNTGNTARLDVLLRGGNLYLSLEDAIALALENNIFVEVQRYGALIAETNVTRARAGGLIRNGLPGV